MYRAFIWLGAERIQQVMHAKGYIVGTSQVNIPQHTCAAGIKGMHVCVI